jgi:hypothetical protein
VNSLITFRASDPASCNGFGEVESALQTEAIVQPVLPLFLFRFLDFVDPPRQTGSDGEGDGE